MTEFIEHSGTVEKIDSQFVIVRIEEPVTDCNICQARNVCIAAGSGAKYVTVSSAGIPETISKGTRVTVKGRSAMSSVAVVLAFVVPVILITVAVTLVIAMTGNDGFGALAGLIVLILYYLALYICRNKLSKRFVFTITKI
ncbi:MAG: SoxR reducing system RseC family protein [Tannerella sp.]|jgi:sigma-E factor negative regulatory protein RseC|nr:SoxR reducing system RseC family protein [Tannerella sp.]